MQSIKQASVNSQAALNVEVRDQPLSLFGEWPRVERRKHRRHELDMRDVIVERWDGPRGTGKPFGRLVNLSPGGLRIVTSDGDFRVGAQLRIRMVLPVYAGITPFVAADGSGRGCNEWCGWMSVTRVTKSDQGDWIIAGRLVDMRDIDRGMLGLYLSAQPLAA